MSGYLKHLGQFYQAFSEFLYPSVCIVCSERSFENRSLVCDDCRTNLYRNRMNVLASGERRLNVKKYFSFIAWRFEYSDKVREIIHHFKFKNFPVLFRMLGGEMAETVLSRSELQSADGLVPVPLHRTRFRVRGYNQSELLSGYISEITGLPNISVLERIKNNKPQSYIENKKEKFANVRGVFSFRPEVSIKGKRLILVDDVVTTGATVNECSKVLKKAGAREVMVLTACYTQ